MGEDEWKEDDPVGWEEAAEEEAAMHFPGRIRYDGILDCGRRGTRLDFLENTVNAA